MEQEDLNNSSEWFDGTVTVFARRTLHHGEEKCNVWGEGYAKSPFALPPKRCILAWQRVV